MKRPTHLELKAQPSMQPTRVKLSHHATEKGLRVTRHQRVKAPLAKEVTPSIHLLSDPVSGHYGCPHRSRWARNQNMAMMAPWMKNRRMGSNRMKREAVSREVSAGDWAVSLCKGRRQAERHEKTTQRDIVYRRG